MSVTRRSILSFAAAMTFPLWAGAAFASQTITYLFPAPDFLPAFAPFHLAKAKGYYKAEGLDVTFQVGKGGADVAKQVALGNADLGGGLGDTSMIVRANGLQVRGVALLGGKALNQIVVRKDAGVSSLKDLKGKKIGVIAFQDTGYYTLLGALASQGLSKDDLSIQAVGNAGIVQLMISKNLDAISSVPDWTAAIQAAGVDVDVYPVNEIFPAMSQAILASDAIIKERPQAVAGFVRATLKAVKDIIDDPKAASVAYVAAVPQHKGKEAAIEDVLRRYVEFVYKVDKPTDLGRFDPERLAKVQKFYLDSGIVNAAVPVSELYTNDFINGSASN